MPQLTCSRCGAPLPEGAKACDACGAAVTLPWMRTCIIVFAVLAAIVFLLFGGCFILLMSGRFH